MTSANLRDQLEGNRGGATFRKPRDYERLNRQAKRVFDFMMDGHWRTLRQISDAVRSPEASVSARMRDFRKEKFGSHEVERRHMVNGLHEYRLIVNYEDTD